MIQKVYVTVDTIDKVKDMAKHIKDSDTIAFDIETTSLNPRQGKIIGFSVCATPGISYYIPTLEFYDNELIDCLIDGNKASDYAVKLLELLHGKKIIAHNASFDMRFTKNYYGIDLLDSLYCDTMLLVHTVQEGGASLYGGFGLKDIAKSIQQHIGLDVEKEANEEQIELKNSIKNNGGSVTKDNFEIYKADMPILAKYAAADTDLTLRIFNYYSTILTAEELEQFFYVDEVMPLYKEVTIPMEENGIKLDMDLIHRTKAEITEAMSEYEDKIYKELMSNDNVKQWVLSKALEKFPATNKGKFAQTLAENFSLELPKSDKTDKYIINRQNVQRLPESDVKVFLLTGDESAIDQSHLVRVSMALWKEANDGQYFNIKSKDHMGEIAFDVFGIKPLSATKKGKPQFDDDMIQSIADKYEWARLLRIYNRMVKIRSTYVERFIDGEENGRYYFSYKQHGTVSGRYGSDAQQLPRPKEEGDDEPIVIEFNNRIRAFLISDENNIFIDNDYESLEPHVFAHVSGDEGLKDIFRNGWDFYSTIAIKTENLKQYSPDKKAENYLKKVAPKLRNKAKAYSLGIPYGLGAYALAMTLNIPQKDAKRLVDGYLNAYPELKMWMEESREQAKTLGFVKTQVGRIRHLSKVKRIYDTMGDGIMDWEVRKLLERQYGKEKVRSIYMDYKNGLNNSINFCIQSLSASIVNRAAIQINRQLKKAGIKGWVCAQIHDQIVTEVEELRSEEAAKIVQDCMENTTKISLDLKAPPQMSKNFRDGH